jgi:hypothetical protein
MDRDFAKIVVQNVRDNYEAFDRDTLQLSDLIASSPNPTGVVNALPSVLQNEPYEIVDILHSAVHYIPAFRDVDLFGQVDSLRTNQG